MKILSPFHSELKESYLQYSLSVIIGRAIPSAKDGLKPVQRRILYSMYKIKNLHNAPFKKSARIVGDTMGRLHPHGDAPIYEALVRMAQDFSYRYPLIEGQGNFGSIDGDPPAAMRYTEARLNRIAEDMLTDIEKETVQMVPNFDNTTKEPVVLPTKIPNLIINGSSGIAVGISTNIPPHNLGEVCDAIVYLIDHPNATVNDLMQFVQGPDFPTGGVIHGKKGIIEAYTTGKGKVVVEGEYHFEEGKHDNIVIDSIPYGVPKSRIIEEIASLEKEKNIGIRNIRDESDKHGIRIVIELSKGEDKDYIINQILSYTSLRTTFNIINVAILDNKPVLFTLPELIQVFINHRKEVITSRTKFDLKNAKSRLHLVEGFLLARSKLDEVVQIIKEAQTISEAKAALQKLGLDEVQAEAVLDIKLRSLTKLETKKLEEEKIQLNKSISEFEEILTKSEKLFEVIKNEINEIKQKYADKRKTKIVEEELQINEEELIKDEDVVIVLTNRDYIKRIPLEAFRQQRRGGVGIRSESEEAVPKKILITNTKERIFIFTNLGRIYYLDTYRILEAGRYAEGRAIRNFVSLRDNETIVDITDSKGKWLVFVTRKGKVKKTAMENFVKLNKSGKIAIKIKDDELIGVKACEDSSNIIIATRKGAAIRFLASDLRPMGRNSFGVRGIKLKSGDEVVGFAISNGEDLLTVTTKGFGKKTSLNEYRLQKRGGKGVRNIKLDEKNGEVVGILPVKEGEEVFLINSKGVAIRIPSAQIRQTGRAAKGVKLMDVKDSLIVDCKTF